MWNRTNRRNAHSRGRTPSSKKEGSKEPDFELKSPPSNSSTPRKRTLSVTSIEVTLNFAQPQSFAEVLSSIDTNLEKSVPAGPSRTSAATPVSPSLTPNSDGISRPSFFGDCIRSQSPTSMFPRCCEGYCREQPGNGIADHPHPLVVSISASRDNQTAWGDQDDSVTLALIKILKETPTPSFHDLMTRLNHHVHASTVEMHRYAREIREKGSAISSENEIKVEMNNFQEPQLGSISPLNMDDPFIL